MLKKLKTVLLIACSLNAFAVPLHNKTRTAAQKLHGETVAATLQRQAVAQTASKTTGVQKRVIANAYISNGQLTDSNRYYYSNGRGSVNTTPESYYDDFYITAIDPQKTILCDSSVRWHDYGSGLQWAFSNSYDYDAGNHVSEVSKYYTTVAYTSKAVYNTAGQLVEITSSDTTTMYVFYNAQGKRISDSTFDFGSNHPMGKRVYTYDAGGNRTVFNSWQYLSGNWKLTYVNLNTYDGSNRLVTSVSILDLGSGLQNSNKDSFAYQGNNTKPYYHLNQDWDALNSVWENADLTYSHYNAQNLLDTYYMIEYTGVWDTVERDVHTYDADGLLLRTNGYEYMGAGVFNPVPYDESRQYYELYSPSATGTVAKEQSNTSIYPNPASNMVTVKAGRSMVGEVAIYNVQGCLISRVRKDEINGTSIDISAYAAGNYFISITSREGAPVYTTMLIKQ